MRWQQHPLTASIPMRIVGPVKINSAEVRGLVSLPLATFETPLWFSTHRGAQACNKTDGIHAVIVDERMTRSVLLEADSALDLYAISQQISLRKEKLKEIAAFNSRFTELLDIHTQLIGSLLYLRLELLTGDAAGHNMTTLAAERILNWILSEYPALRYVSISGNFCADKKVSAVNGLLGRGKNVIAEVTLPHTVCTSWLKTTPRQIVNLHIKKNLLGSIVAGGLRTANAHFANILLGFYLATGQDAANLVEGSQGIVHAEEREGALYFSVTLPHLILGTVGNGKSHDFVNKNLALLGCLEKRETGYNARRLAIIAAAAVLCGELSLLAAQTNRGELMRSHLKLERRKQQE